MARPGDENREDRALDALMAAAFRLERPDEPVSEEETMRLVEKPPPLSPEDVAALDSLGPDFVDRLLAKQRVSSPPRHSDEPVIGEEIAEAYAAMHRGRQGDELSDETRKEIERKRQELLGQLQREEEGQDET